MVFEGAKLISIRVLIGIFPGKKHFGIFLGMYRPKPYTMKNLTGFAVVICALILISFRSSFFNIDQVAVAMRSGNVSQLSAYLDTRVDISLPDQSDTYSKSQAEMIIRDFFSTNRVQAFQVKHKGENGGSEFCIGILKTSNGDFRTTLFMKNKGDRQLLQELRFQPVE
jgi:hypothetical protein